MKKVLIFLVVMMMTVSAMATPSGVQIAAVAGDCNAVISYENTTDANLIRGFGLDISVDNDANIIGIEVLESDYRIFPGQIVIVDGNVIDYNTPYASGSLGNSTVSVELASLYTTDPCYQGDPNYGYNAIPPGGGPNPLLLVTVSNSCNITIIENAASGGVVMERPADTPSVNLGPATTVAIVCGWIYPDCWKWPGQCHGDCEGNDGDVDNSDFLLVFKPAYATSYPGGNYNPCADLDRDGDVDNTDFLITFKPNYTLSGFTGCPPGDPCEIYKP